MDLLKSAIQKDPSYKRMAENDADIIDLLKDVMAAENATKGEDKNKIG